MATIKKNSVVSEETRSVITSIRRLVQSLRVASRDSEKKVGLSAAQLFVLKKLAEEKNLSLNTLADRTLTHQSSVSVVVQRLVEKGLINRERFIDDGRQLVLNLTSKGKKLVAKAPHARQDWLIVALETMTTKSRRQLDDRLIEMLKLCGLDHSPAPMLFSDVEGAKKPKKKKAKA